MTSNDKIEATSKSPDKREDRLEIVKILILAVVSFVAGFLLIFFFLKPSTPSEVLSDAAPDFETDASADNEETTPPAENDADAKASTADEAPTPVAAAPVEALPEVPPGQTPDGVHFDGSAYYLKCWDEGGIEHPAKECDRLNTLENRFAERLYVVDQCRISEAGAGASGKLSVAMEVDFSKMSVSFWNGASSEIREASGIGNCLRKSLAGMPVHSIDHRFNRYRVFFTVLFGQAPAAKAPPVVAEKEGGSAPTADRGKRVNVIKDRVRVRQSPVDGDVIGKISTGNQVQLLQKKDAWCNVITPNGNEGWMICDALEQ